MKNKIAALVTVGLISVSGVLAFANNNSPKDEYDPSLGGGCIDLSGVEGIVESDEIGVRGVVTDIKIDGDKITIRVEGTLDKDTKYDIADVMVDKYTIITGEGSSTPLEIKDIEKGQSVEVIFQGPESRSYPVLVNSYSIRIIEDNK